MRASRSLRRTTRDRRAQLAAGTLVVAGAAAVGKVAADRHTEDDGHSGPSRAYRLKTKESAADGIRRIALGRADKALERLATPGGDVAQAIHGARKDLKKIRAVLRLIREELGDEFYREENRRYRDAGRLLSESRDAEVKLETLAALRSRFDDDFPADVAKSWEDALRQERDENADSSAGELADRIKQASSAIEEGRDRIAHWTLKGDSWALVEPGIARSYRRGRQALKSALEKPSAENVHEWRKRSKDLWYQLRIVREAWPALLKATIAEAHELADLLGDHHDLSVLAQDLASRPAVGEHKAIAALIEQRQQELLDCAAGLGRRLYAEKPKAFSRRLAGYWQAWREETSSSAVVSP